MLKCGHILADGGRHGRCHRHARRHAVPPSNLSVRLYFAKYVVRVAAVLRIYLFGKLWAMAIKVKFQHDGKKSFSQLLAARCSSEGGAGERSFFARASSLRTTKMTG